MVIKVDFKVTARLYPEYSLFKKTDEDTWKLVRKGIINRELLPNGNLKTYLIPSLTLGAGDTVNVDFGEVIKGYGISLKNGHKREVPNKIRFRLPKGSHSYECKV